MCKRFFQFVIGWHRSFLSWKPICLWDVLWKKGWDLPRAMLSHVPCHVRAGFSVHLEQLQHKPKG